MFTNPISRRAATVSFSLLLLAGPLLALSVRGFAAQLTLSGLAASIALIIQPSKLDWQRLKPYALPLSAFGYILLSAAWSVSERAGDTALRLTLTSGFAVTILLAFHELAVEEKSKWVRRFIASVSGGIIIALIIGPYNVYWPKLPALLEAHFELLRQVNSSLSIMPVFLFLAGLVWTDKKPRFAAFIIAAALLATLLSESQTSLLAMILGLVAFGLAKLHRNLPRPLIFAALAICTVFSVPFFKASFQNDWVQNYAPTIVQEKGAGEIRQWIYYVYASEAVEKPLLGHGLNGTKYFSPHSLKDYTTQVIDNREVRYYAQQADKNDVIAAHAHNLFLQIVFEFGYLGALLILAAIWQLFTKLDKILTLRQAPWVWGAIGASLGTLMFGFTIWHSWLMAALAMMVIFARAVLHAAHSQSATGTNT